MEKEGNIEDCLKVHERIHLYLLSHEELMFRNEYVTNYVYLLLKQEMYDKLELVLLNEIWFLKDHLEDSKARKNEIFNWKIALGLVYMMTNNMNSAELLVGENKVRHVDSSNTFNIFL